MVGLPAKPIIDVDLVVADPADEPAYVPDLEAAGFVHLARESWWHEHRLLKYSEPVANVHTFGPECPEVVRHQMFQTWLREHPDDFTAYAEAKRAAATEMNARPGGGTGMDYNRHKEPVVQSDLRPDVPCPRDAAVTIRPATDQDLAGIAAIYDEQVRTGTRKLDSSRTDRARAGRGSWRSPPNHCASSPPWLTHSVENSSDADVRRWPPKNRGPTPVTPSSERCC